MKFGKKSQAGFMWGIIVFFIAAMISMFIGLLIYNIGSDYVVDNLYNVSTDIGTDLGFSTQMMTNFDNIQLSYGALGFPFDLFFLVTFISMLIATIQSAYMSRKLGTFSFFGMLTIGTMIFTAVMFFVSQFTNWFVVNLIDLLFIVDTPIFDFVFANLNIISVVWFMLLLLINQLDFSTMIEQGGRFEE